MPKNLEIKAIVPSFDTTLAACRRLGAKKAGMLRQTDTYFAVKKGRLKLREINGREFELIYYERVDRKGSRYSNYVTVPLDEPEAMKRVCTTLFGVRAVVRKERMLYLYRNARIHLDRVEGLGSFVEFEVLVKRGKEQSGTLMDLLVRECGIAARATIAGSYVDLLSRKSGRSRLRKV